jgi:hypothetical protein
MIPALIILAPMIVAILAALIIDHEANHPNP